MMFVTHISPNTGVHQKHIPKGYGGNTGVIGEMPYQITLMLPLTDMAEMDRITGRLSYLDQ